MKVSLRRFTCGDIHYLDQWSSEINSDNYMKKIMPLRFDGNNFHRWGQDFTWFVIVADGRDIGSVWIDSRQHRSEIGILGIIIGKTGSLGKGIGTRAIGQAIFISSYFLGFNRVRLTVRQSNIRAIKAYKKCGFNVTGQGVSNLENGEKTGFYRMEKVLLDVPFREGTNQVFDSCRGKCPCSARICELAK